MGLESIADEAYTKSHIGLVNLMTVLFKFKINLRSI